MEDTVIVVPSKRKAPLKTLEAHDSLLPIIVLSDPDVFAQHQEFYHQRMNTGRFFVVEGVKGSIPQALEVYKVAARKGFQYVFRMDDDIQKKYFVHRDGSFPSLDSCVSLARQCLDVTKTTFAGFANTARRDWLGEEGVFKRTYGLIHGGSAITIATEDAEQFLDPELMRYDDVYRSAAHRKRDGAVGRVTWIGIDKRESLRDSATDDSPEIQENARRIILGTFPDMVSCDGHRILDGGLQVIPNWRMKGRVKPI